MSRSTKIGANEQCPCGSGKKFKRCCKGRVNWESLAGTNSPDYARHLTLRGKNLLFVQNMLSLLQIDTHKPRRDFGELKRAFSPKVVQGIHLAIQDVWPDLDDYERCLAEQAESVTAIYTGTYEPEAIFRAVTRHALYSEKIYLVDPFLDPRNIREKYSPLAHPDEHRATTIKHAFLWISLYPWIEAGIVSFVRPLTDFVPDLSRELYDLEHSKVEKHPELQQAIEEHSDAIVNAATVTDKGFKEYYFLSHPDDFFRDMYVNMPADKRSGTLEDFLEWIRMRRATHPYYVERLPGQRSEFLHQTSGASYELTKRMCTLSHSHMITDLAPRWKEIELDRVGATTDDNWEPFAKALQHAPLKVLDSVTLEAALRLREEERLEPLRHFFRKVWKSCREPNQFSRENATNLAAELNEKISEAKTEWKRIDQDALKWATGTGASATAAAFAGFMPAAAGATVGAVGTLIHSYLKRLEFKERYPAGFFLGLKARE